MTHAALRHADDQEGGPDGIVLAAVADPTADVAERLAGQDDVRRLRELADELTADQRLVLACQIALDMDCQEFCARFGWSAEKFRKVAQRARARLRALVADYEAGERCRSLADDLAAYVAHVAGGEQSERVRRHLTNCPACAQTARELERVARGVGALLPLPPAVDPEVVVHRVGAVGRIFGRLLPFWDSGEGAAAAKAGAAAAGGGGGIAAGGSVVGLGAAKLGVTALCVAGAAGGGYVVCDQVGLFSGPLPRERQHVTTTANAAHKAPLTRRVPSPAVTRAPAPISRTIRRPPATATSGARQRSSAASASPSNQASNEFGFEGAGGTTGSAPASSSSSSSPSARAASAGAQSAPITPSSPRPPPAASAHKASTEFGFE